MSDPIATIINPIPTEVKNISSACTNQDYRLFVSVPMNYADSNLTFPVLYLLDGNGLFPLIRPIVEMQLVAKLLPDLIIVGIGYPTNTYMETVALRGHDLTFRELSSEEKAGGYPWGETGGGNKFLDFIVEELIPFVDRHYRTQPANRTLLGLSLSASFALQTIIQQPDIFQQVIAISPTIDKVLFDKEAQYATDHSSLPVKLFIAIEAPEGIEWYQEQIKQLQSLIAIMEQRNYTGWQATLRTYEGDDHFSVAPIGSVHGLRHIFRPS